MPHEITLEHTTDTGHRIVGHEGKCARLHGHTYRWLVTCKSEELVEPGFVIDFGDLKDYLNEWDHRLLLWEEDPWYIAADQEQMRTVSIGQSGIVRVPFNPTAEHMAKHMAETIRRGNSNIYYVSIELYETPKSRAKAESWG